ncbi:MAG: hydrocarbon degradation protein [Thiothrix sp.]|nr:MAG: hydrocarbon degradation protein [Thiothrix sp.]
MEYKKRIYLSTVACLLLGSVGGHAEAAGFAIIEHSASGMGNAFAGAAAVANDASTAWFNPAGLTLIKTPQLMVAGHLIDASSEFTDKGSSVSPALTGGAVVPGSITGSNDDGVPGAAFVPNFYYVRPLGDKVSFGLAINAAFGLETDYEDDWVGRYHGLNSALTTLNINPSLGWKINDQLSLGAGVSLQYVNAELSGAIDSTAACLGLAGTNSQLLQACTSAGLGPGTQATLENDSKGKNESDSIAVGFNLGLMYSVNEATRLGMAYRSGITQSTEGDAKFTVNENFKPVLEQINAGLRATNAGKQFFTDTDITAEVDLPPSLSLSIAHQANARLQLLGDITWTGWSSFEELRIKYASGQNDTATDESWEDVIRLSMGGNYQLDDKWTLRAGVAFDEEAIPDEKHRTPRIPGNDRWWLSLGAGLNVSKKIHLDFGFAHLFLDDFAADHTDDNGYSFRGEYSADINIASAQLNWNF